ncbi:unnamed protein product [Prunus armeniaca]
MEDKNPGSATKMQCEFVDGETVFKHLYICLEPLKRWFKMNCRPFIGLDVCHLKGVYDGQLLIAVGIDPNNKTWVLAYAVVEMETRGSHGHGLPGAFKDIVPNAETRFCVRHHWDNFNKKYKGKVLRDQSWTCAKATNVPCFKYQMEVMKILDSNAWEWLAEKPPTQWTRDRPIITLLEMISGLVVLNIKWMQEEVTSMWWIWIITLVLAESETCQAFLVLMELLPYITKEITSMGEANQTTIKPPAYTRQPGRPRKVRIKGVEERIDKM